MLRFVASFQLAAAAMEAQATTDASSLIKMAIDPIVAAMSEKYTCAISVALRGAGPDADVVRPLEVASAAGLTDRLSGRVAQPSDAFVWGSVTKVVTGAGVLRLVDQGKISLEDAIPQHVDPLLARTAAVDPEQTFKSLEELWGPEVHNITVRDLLAMRSGVPDYDTASPTGKTPTDFFRADAYDHPSRAFSPGQLLTLPWVRTGALLFAPGVCDREKYFNCYSSTNYVLLGMLLANEAGASRWQDYSQQAALSPATSDFHHIQFALAGPPSSYTAVKGFDTTHYNNNTRAIDVSGVAGVFGGWTAANLVADAADVAALGQDLYGPGYKLVSKPLVDEMYAQSAFTGYGLATFNLSSLTPNDVAYGHLGATYGYQSLLVYAPGLNLSLAIGTSIERDRQDQPKDVFCSVYNTAKAILLGRPIPRCTFSATYWGGACECEDGLPVVASPTAPSLDQDVIV